MYYSFNYVDPDGFIWRNYKMWVPRDITPEEALCEWRHVKKILSYFVSL